MKITLKNLHKATEQQVFDQVAKHLLTQNKRSTTATGCVYHNPDGLKCAAGCLIADDEYQEDFEGKAWTDLVNTGEVPGTHMKLIRKLQGIHDTKKPGDWKLYLKELAGVFFLNTKVLESCNEYSLTNPLTEGVTK